jgi:general secretion pathway protein J
MNGARGFTLLELLIGMTLLGFILALLFGGFRLAANSWNAVDERAERSADEQATRALVRRLVNYAQPLRWNNVAVKALQAPQTGPSLAFSAGRERLQLVAPLAGRIGLRVVELAIEPDEAVAGRPLGLRLLLRNGPVRYNTDDFTASLDSDPQGRTLLGGLDSAAFAYYGPEKRGDPPQWLAQWPAMDRLPMLVRLHLEPRQGSVIDLDMVPMVNGDRTSPVRFVAGPQ